MQLLSKMFAVDAAANGGDVVAGLASDVGDFRNFASADGTFGGDDAANLIEICFNNFQYFFEKYSLEIILMLPN